MSTAPTISEEKVLAQLYSTTQPDPSQMNEAVLVECVKDPRYFIRNFCKIEVTGKGLTNFDLFEYQERTLATYMAHRFVFILKSRQMGYTTLAAAYSLWYTLKPGNNVLFLSKKEDDAMDILRKTKIMYDNLPKELQVGVASSNATTLEFNNKNRIQSLPATERAGAGKSAGLIILDEFSGFPAAKDRVAGEDVWTSILPTISTGGRVIVQSTPKGMGNQFYRLWSGENNFKKYFVHWTKHPTFGKDKYKREDPSDGYGVWGSPWADDIMSNMTPDGWAQEFNGDFVQSGRPVFNWKHLIKYPVSDDDKRYDCHYAVGVDLASGSGADYSVAQVINIDTGKQVETIRSKDPLDIFGLQIIEKCRDYNNAKLSFENNSGYGLTFMKHISDYENLYYQTKFDKSREKKTRKLGWNTNTKTKELMISDLNIALKKKHIKLTDSETIKEMKVFQYDDNDKMQAQAGFHDDCVMSLAIAWQCALSVHRPTERDTMIRSQTPIIAPYKSPVVSWEGTIPADILNFHTEPVERDWRLA